MPDINNSKIIFLRGEKGDLPEQLDSGELAFTTDDGTLVIGSDGRFGQANIDRTEFPYRNIEVLTERSEETFAKMHGDRMREGTEYDYYECRLEPDRLAWTPVLIDNDGEYTPYRIEILNSVSMFVDYTVTENELGEPIRDGQLIVWQHSALGNINSAQFTDKSSMPRERNLTNPSNYDPRQVFEKVKFNFRISDDARFLEFEYKNYTFDILCLQFRVSRPLDAGAKNVLAGRVIISADLEGIAEAPVPDTIFAIISGRTEITGESPNINESFLRGYKLTTDTEGNIYVAGEVRNNSFNSSSAVIAKYNSDMELIWQQDAYLESAGQSNYYARFNDIVVHSNKLWVCGFANTFDTDIGILSFPIVARFSLDGVLEENFVMNDTNKLDAAYNSMVVTDTQIYLAGNSTQGIYQTAYVTAISTTTGAPTWSKILRVPDEGGGFDFSFSNILLDGDKLVVVGYLDYSELYVAKYNLDGSIVWTKCFDSQNYGATGETSTVIDSDGNIYIGDIDHNNYDFFFITKLASDGTKVFERYYGVEDNYRFSMPYLFINDGTLHVVSACASPIMLMDFTLEGVYIRSRFIDAGYGLQNSNDQFDRFITAHVANGFFYVMNGRTATHWTHKFDETTVSRFLFDATNLNFEDAMHLYIPEAQWNISNGPTDPIYVEVDPVLFFEISTSTDLRHSPSGFENLEVTESLPNGPESLDALTYLETPYPSNSDGWIAEQIFNVTFKVVGATTTPAGDVYQLVLHTSAANTYFILKYNAAGTIIFAKRYIYAVNTDSNMHVILYDESLDSDGLYICHNDSTTSSINVTKLSLDASTVLWHKNYDSPGEYQTGSTLVALSTDSLVITINNFNQTRQDFLRIAKETGNVMVSTSFAGLDGVWTSVHKGDFVYTATVLGSSGVSYLITKFNIVANTIEWQKNLSIPAIIANTRALRMKAMLVNENNDLIMICDEDVYSAPHDEKIRRILFKTSTNAEIDDYRVYTFVRNNERVIAATQNMTIAPSCVRDPITGYIYMISEALLHAGSGFILECYDNNLNPLWGRVVATEGNSESYTINLMPNDNLLITSEADTLMHKSIVLRIPRTGEVYLRDRFFSSAFTITPDETLVPTFTNASSYTGVVTSPVVTATNPTPPALSDLTSYTHIISPLPN